VPGDDLATAQILGSSPEMRPLGKKKSVLFPESEASAAPVLTCPMGLTSSIEDHHSVGPTIMS
jgi:hypothetical protein